MAAKVASKGKKGTGRGAGAKRQTRAVRSGARKSYGERRLPRFLRLLRGKLPELQAKYKVKSLGVFGSYVRNDATKKSDLDVLVEFEEDARVTLFDLVGFQDELTDLLGVKVDLVDKLGLRPRILANVLPEVVEV